MFVSSNWFNHMYVFVTTITIITIITTITTITIITTITTITTTITITTITITITTTQEPAELEGGLDLFPIRHTVHVVHRDCDRVEQLLASHTMISTLSVLPSLRMTSVSSN